MYLKMIGERVRMNQKIQDVYNKLHFVKVAHANNIQLIQRRNETRPRQRLSLQSIQFETTTTHTSMYYCMCVLYFVPCCELSVVTTYRKEHTVFMSSNCLAV